MSKLTLPAKSGRGTDVCGHGGNMYIVRSDLKYYMRYNIQSKDIVTYSLHDSVADGEHYLASESHFYIIDGNQYKKVANLNKGGATQYSLHPKCKGGIHYFSGSGYFYIIFDDGTYGRTTNMNKGSDWTKYNLHEDCRDGLYYWATINFNAFPEEAFYFISPDFYSGVKVHMSTNQNKNYSPREFVLDEDVINFFPGGIGATLGAGVADWDPVAALENILTVESPLTYDELHKIGRSKATTEQVTNSWSVNVETNNKIFSTELKVQAGYSGSVVNTESYTWSEEEERRVTIGPTIVQPGQKLYIWQKVVKFGDTIINKGAILEFPTEGKPPIE